ncbi:MAG: T9SS type A sorting domain-containing protein [Bacteroidetes bacterium]|nr:T9SS type A sorting domain-containing protein [Bacteroidota bacterium]
MRNDIWPPLPRMLVLTATLLAMLAVVTHAQLRISRCVIAAGGTQSTGNGLTLQGTIGQSLAGTAKGSAHAGFFGFWYNEGNTVVGVREPPLAAAAVPRIGSLHPNPARDEVTVTVLATGSEPVTIMLLDLLGRVHAHPSVNVPPNGESTLKLPLHGLPPGYYIVTIPGTAETHGLIVR